MPPNAQNSPSPEGEVVQPSSNQDSPSPSGMSEAVSAQLMHIVGGSSGYKPTKSQVDKMLALREKGMDYTHKERTMFQPKQLLDFGAGLLILLFIIAILLIIVIKVPQYTGEAISSILGLIGGGGAGYAFGVKSRQDDE